MGIRVLEAKALTLPLKQRARLAERLLASLETPGPEERDAPWKREIERRLKSWTAADSARTSKIVFRNVRKRLG